MPLPALEPEITTFLEQRHGAGGTAGIRREAISSPDSASGAMLERLTLPATLDGETRYVVKRLRPRGDWIARATNDERLREYRLLRGGIYRALPDEVGTAVIEGVELADGGAALIMHDVSAALVPPGDDPLSEEQLTRSLRGLARLHATFYGFPARLMAGLNLCILPHWLTLLAPATAEREAQAEPPDPITPLIVPGWEAFSRLAPDAWRVVEPLLADPLSLVIALRQSPDTFVHGDAKAGNLAFAGQRLILLDWSQTLRAPGALDLGWYLAVNSARLPTGREAAIEIYRAAREEHGRLPASDEPWERELALALLAGTLRLGWAKALGAGSDDPLIRAREQVELEFWADAALAAQHWMG